MISLVVRPATVEDLDGLVAVEKFAFNPVGAGAMCTRESFERRIGICNIGGVKWLFVAVGDDGQIHGYMNLMPTAFGPNDCTSWNVATGDGTLSTYDQDGKNVYVVSLARGEHAPKHAAAMLVQHSFELWQAHGGLYMFCSRMPGFARAHEQTGITAEQYWRATRAGDGTPQDGLLREYSLMLGGVSPLRLLENGWSPDTASGGHGVLFAAEDPDRALRAIAKMLGELVDSGRPSVRAMTGEYPTGPDGGDDAEKIGPLLGGDRRWWHTLGMEQVDATVVFMPFGCPDFGEPKYQGRNPKACTFCALPSAVEDYRVLFYDGRPVSDDELIRLVGPTFTTAFAVRGYAPHTVMLFNAGSFTAMSERVRTAVVDVLIARSEGRIKQFVVESRPQLVTREILAPMVERLSAAGIGLTIRLGIETKDSRLRLRVLGKGSSTKAITDACALMRELGITAGGYALLKPAPGIDPGEARAEAVRTIKWMLASTDAGGLQMDEIYLHPTCVSPGTPIAAQWEKREFSPASLWDVLWVLKTCLREQHAGRIHLMPFKDVPPFVAVPGIMHERGLPENLDGATEHERAFHAMLERYRARMEPGLLTTDGFGPLPAWWT